MESMQKRTGRIGVTVWMVCLVLAGGMSSAWALQETPATPPAPAAAPAAPPESASPPVRQPKAKSQEEFAAYLKFMREPKPDEQIRLIEDFLLQYKDSELKEFAFQSATQAYQSKNDYDKVLTYGELTLVENENNLVALLVLASAIPERTGKNDADRDEKLAEAEQYGKRALDLLQKLPQPANLTPGQWEQTKREAASTSHAALGMMNLIREDFEKAEAELKLAADLASQPDPVTFYRLGLAYSFQKKFDLALDALERAAGVGGVKIPNPDGGTRDLVAEAKDFVLKARAAAGGAAPSGP